MLARLPLDIEMLMQLIFRSAAAAIYWKNGLHRRIPAMGFYLLLDAGQALFAFIVLSGMVLRGQSECRRFACLLFTRECWVVYIVCAALLFHICTQILRTSLSQFPSLMRATLIAFRCTAAISLGLAVIAAPLTRLDAKALSEFIQLTWMGLSVLQLSLLIFLCLFMKELRFSIRNLGLGVSLGLGLSAGMDLISVLLDRIHGSSDINQTRVLVTTWIQLLVPIIWITYFTRPEPERAAQLTSTTSVLHRWNEIAAKLGHRPTKVAMQHPSNGKLLADVEQVAEKVLERT